MQIKRGGGRLGAYSFYIKDVMLKIFALFLMGYSLALYADTPGSAQSVPPLPPASQNENSVPDSEEEEDGTGETDEDVIIDEEENTNEDEGVTS